MYMADRTVGLRPATSSVVLATACSRATPVQIDRFLSARILYTAADGFHVIVNEIKSSRTWS